MGVLDLRKLPEVLGDLLPLIPRRVLWGVGLLLFAFAGAAGLKSIRPVVAEQFALERVVRERADLIRSAASESGVDPTLLAAMMCKESSGRLDARSYANALGLFQLRLPTAVEQAGKLNLPAPTEADLLSDGELNARLGANYFAYLLKRFEGSERQALIAYNTGPTRFARMLRESGGWDAWHAERKAAGNSQLLAYMNKVLEFQDRIAERGIF